MEMWLKRSTLVLLIVAVAAMGKSARVVILNENQQRVDVPFGSSVTLKCNLNTTTFSRFRMEWYFNPSGSSFSASHILKKTSTLVTGGQQDTENTSFILSNAIFNDSGWYFCKVTAEIPSLDTINSNGTHVVITNSMEHTTYPSLPIVTGKQATVSPTVSIDWWVWITFGVSSFILCVLLVLCILLRRRRRRSREDPVYANTRRVANKQPSPRPGMPVENLKAASSFQNLRNPSPGRRHDENKRRHKE